MSLLWPTCWRLCQKQTYFSTHNTHALVPYPPFEFSPSPCNPPPPDLPPSVGPKSKGNSRRRRRRRKFSFSLYWKCCSFGVCGAIPEGAEQALFCLNAVLGTADKKPSRVKEEWHKQPDPVQPQESWGACDQQADKISCWRGGVCCMGGPPAKGATVNAMGDRLESVVLRWCPGPLPHGLRMLLFLFLLLQLLCLSFALCRKRTGAIRVGVGALVLPPGSGFHSSNQAEVSGNLRCACRAPDLLE